MRKMLIGKLYVIKLPPKENGGITQYLPLLHMIPKFDELPKGSAQGYLRPLKDGLDGNGFCVREDEIFDYLIKFLAEYRRSYDIYALSDGITKNAYEFYRKNDFYNRAWKVKGVKNLAYILTGKGMEKAESLEEYTRAGYALTLVYSEGGKEKKKRFLTTDEYEIMDKVIGNGIADYHFSFSDKSIYFASFASAFKEMIKITKFFPRYFVIDTNPLETDKVKKEYFCAKKKYGKYAVTTPYPRRALKFRTEDNALEWAVQNCETFRSGGFEICGIHEEGQICCSYTAPDKVFSY